MTMQNKSSTIENKNKGPVSDCLPILIFAAILFYIMYGIVLSELKGDLSDYNGHVYVYLATFTGESAIKGWMMAPYFLWHIVVLFFNKILLLPIETSAALSSSIFLTASYFITVFMISRWCDYSKISMKPSSCGFISFGMTILQPIWVSFLDAGSSRTAGTFSINPLYNPTQMAARPFALLSFMLVLDFLMIIESGSKEDVDAGHTIFFRTDRMHILVILSVTLLMSSIAKPVFAEMFIPSVGIIMLIGWFAKMPLKNGTAGKFFKNSLLPAFCSAIPCILSLLIQFLIYFIFGGSYESNGGFIITGFLEVWSFFSENIPLAVLFIMSFPILILVTDCKNFLKHSYGQLGLVCFTVGFLECALMGEGGDKLYHGDFIWPMSFGMLILWISALLHFLNMDKTASSGFTRFIVTVGWILFIIHVFFGLLFISDDLGWNLFIF